jgi:hypothetical protein
MSHYNWASRVDSRRSPASLCDTWHDLAHLHSLGGGHFLNSKDAAELIDDIRTLRQDLRGSVGDADTRNM